MLCLWLWEKSPKGGSTNQKPQLLIKKGLEISSPIVPIMVLCIKKRNSVLRFDTKLMRQYWTFIKKCEANKKRNPTFASCV